MHHEHISPIDDEIFTFFKSLTHQERNEISRLTKLTNDDLRTELGDELYTQVVAIVTEVTSITPGISDNEKLVICGYQFYRLVLDHVRQRIAKAQ